MPKDGPIYGKFLVARSDGRDAPGADKENADYFVLDIVHDKFAREALMFYAFKCVDEFPQLAADIWNKLRVNVASFENTDEHPVVLSNQAEA